MQLDKVFLVRTVLLAFLWVLPAHAFNEFRASSFPFPFYFKAGDDIILNCWLPEGYAFSHWTRPSGEFVSTTTNRFLVNAVAHTVSLTVTNAVISDAGQYSCNARIGARSASSPVSAHYTEPLVIFSSSVNATVDVGGAYNFSCNASNYLLLQWIFHDQNTPFPRVVSNTSDGRRVITQDNELRLSNIRFEDEGTYECRLTNNLGMIPLKNNVTVIARPEVYTDIVYQEVTENSDATLSCTTTGVPLPTIMWTNRLGDILENSSVWSISISNVNSSVVTSSLTFPKVQSDQTGPYTCWGINKYDNSSATINLRFHDTPEPPQNVMLELVNQTNIRVTWIAPPSSVNTYTIMYRVLNGSSAGDVFSINVDASLDTSALLPGLNRLTNYSVLVYATNSHGASPNSNLETITTSAEVPSQSTAVIVLDVGPTSLRVEWPSSSLPQDDGGATIVGIRITALRVHAGELIPEVIETPNLEDGFVILEGLTDSSSYKIMMEFANSIGYGVGLVSRQYQTPLPGSPGSPIHVMAFNATSNSVLICWLDSSSGQPFLEYKFEVEESGEDRQKTFRKDSDEVTSYPNITGCNKGILVDQLNSESCYKFRVIAINKVGTGQPSPPSEEVCTTKVDCEGSDCSLQNCLNGGKCSPSKEGLTGTMVITIAVVSAALVVLCVACLVTVACCVSARKTKKRKLEKEGDCIPGINRRGSSNSATKLLSVGRSLSGSFSSSSPNQSPEASLEQPGTATTLVPNVFEADFAKTTHPDEYLRDSPKFNVSVAHTPSHDPQQMFFMPEGHQQGMFQLPQSKKYGESFASADNGCQGLDAPPSYNVCINATDSANTPASGQVYLNPVDDGHLVMTDNPNYDDRVLPSRTYGQSSNDLDHSRSSTPPPVPPYYGGSTSDMQSEAIANHYTDAAFLGESYSQVGYSPAQGRKGKPTQSEGQRARVSNLSHSKAVPYPPPGATGNKNHEISFVENDAYQTMTEVGGPKFEIKVGEQRGAVREMVQFRKH